ncbi:hypothetical protein AQJ11_02835 [Streptomyces corchorusii]|uniref:Histidine kinase n=2 Tax=Streptomyces TaxID=1883 RepID=A0A101QMC4_STRCK|nr:hypothetical protein [Streptomyces corchorusii]KUN32477.1 hypothetical protein AQJ11_02835 [Streptomyces corchorusii]
MTGHSLLLVLAWLAAAVAVTAAWSARAAVRRLRTHRDNRQGLARARRPDAPPHGGLLCYGDHGDVLCIRPADDTHSRHVPYRPTPKDTPCASPD